MSFALKTSVRYVGISRQQGRQKQHGGGDEERFLWLYVMSGLSGFSPPIETGPIFGEIASRMIMH